MFEGRYIGLMSGTSMDALDAVIARVDQDSIHSEGFYSEPLPLSLKEKILALTVDAPSELERFAILSREIAEISASAICKVLNTARLSASEIIAIGSHGQTVRHLPRMPHTMSFQAGDPHRIAELTGILCIADFRQRDIVCGGEGAPLIPLFHERFLLGEADDKVVINLGGIANVSLRTQRHSNYNASENFLIGFDSGPANGLIDHWARKHLNQPIDECGAWAKSGTCNDALLTSMMNDTYFATAAPKSTGKELFNSDWLEEHLSAQTEDISAKDVQATLVELSAKSIVQSLEAFPQLRTAIACGGGVHNTYLMNRIEAQLRKLHPEFELKTTSEYGIDPQQVEALGFAWFAYQSLNSSNSSVATVTGANKNSVLGALYPGKNGFAPLFAQQI